MRLLLQRSRSNEQEGDNWIGQKYFIIVISFCCFRSERLSESDSGGGGDGGKSVESSVRHKIVVMGAAKVGKSAIINQFLYGTFTPKYKRTVEEMHHGDFNVSGIHLTLDILDTSGSYEFPAMRDLSIKSADAFVLVYDVNDVNTFHEVKTLRALILNTKGVVPIVVVGNKLDLVENEQEVHLSPSSLSLYPSIYLTLITKDYEGKMNNTIFDLSAFYRLTARVPEN